ncbi:histidinol-phosphate transaminase [Membranihabitans marinus]|uniref:histidinol-phosphate transaminase n=1 Tax=Membranihabitans marinus TaxID=1227546 RepID=UPI001F028637|nr:histidinol-phosphate transaminase [Membranihabitans marinus]
MEEKDFVQLVRPNIAALTPYSSARHEFTGHADIYLDANENPFSHHRWNRYPDPFQSALKNKLIEIKKCAVDEIFIGNGSDEAIDLLIRIFCEPGVDQIVTVEPTYGMYRVAADINNVAVNRQTLNPDYSLDIDTVLAHTTSADKILFLCSPNNPTGNAIDADVLLRGIKGFHGIVVIDEAYIDFSSQPSMIQYIESCPNLVILQTFSKAWGLAGLRMGMAFGPAWIIRLMNAVKPPYNINSYSQEIALQSLSKLEEVQDEIATIIEGRNQLRDFLVNHPSVLEVYPSDANFLLFKCIGAKSLFEYLRTEGIVIRDRSNVVLCEDCLRLTVGSPEENKIFIERMNNYNQ